MQIFSASDVRIGAFIFVIFCQENDENEEILVWNKY